MLIPSTYQVALLLMILSAVCWGSWAATQKMAASKWRFELYYLDFSFGVFFGVLLLCFTAGSMNSGDITFTDSLIGLSMRKVAWALVAGFLFNVANVMLVTAISASGLSVAFPITMSIATVIGTAIAYFMAPQGNVTMLGAGLLALVLAVVFSARAYKMLAEVRRAQQVAAEAAANAALAAATPVAAPAKPRVRKTGKSKSASLRGITLSVVAGFLMAGVMPLIDVTREGDLGLAPYATAFFFAGGLLFTSFLIVPFLMNFPMEGAPLEFKQYFGGKGVHLLGLIGGVLWISGLLAMLLSGAVPKQQGIGPMLTQALGQASTILAALWGVLVWKEYDNGGARARLQLTIMFVLLLVGLALTSLAPVY